MALIGLRHRQALRDECCDFPFTVFGVAWHLLPKDGEEHSLNRRARDQMLNIFRFGCFKMLGNHGRAVSIIENSSGIIARAEFDCPLEDRIAAAAVGWFDGDSSAAISPKEHVEVLQKCFLGISLDHNQCGVPHETRLMLPGV